ncbi:hypothetical protein FRC07_004264 [Ceratobasidium sp. 392]|nr:hypothetical protein FRC07_004264 [Ceratobasidium sp. 392]
MARTHSTSVLKLHDTLSSDSGAFSSTPGTQPAIKSALTQWNNTRKRLSRIIESYYTSCRTLHSACITTTQNPVEYSMVEEALATTDLELKSLAAGDKQIRKARAFLTSMRNKSAILAPVNKLPPEILSRIFMLSRVHCVRDNNYGLDGFTDVCMYWRRTALDATNLWTHVDISLVVLESLTSLLFSRSKNAPIHVHVIEPSVENETEAPIQVDQCRFEAEFILAQLEPHFHRVRTLSIESGSSYGRIVPLILNQWSERASTFPRSLMINRPAPGDVLSIPSQNEMSSNLERMLLALDTLHLDYTLFDWASNAYRGLVDFRLDTLNNSITISVLQMTSILSACPTLAILKLGYIEVEREESWAQPAPVVMECLNIVNIIGMEPDYAHMLLSLITLSSPCAELGMTLSTESATDKRLSDFFVRSRVATLCCFGYQYSFEGWKHFFRSIPHPHTVILHDFHMANTLAGSPDDISLLPMLPQDLSSVTVLLECTVNFESLKCLVLDSGTKNLRLERCMSHVPTVPHQSIQEIGSALLEVYPDLQLEISDIDTTRQLACRSMFD